MDSETEEITYKKRNKLSYGEYKALSRQMRYYYRQKHPDLIPSIITDEDIIKMEITIKQQEKLIYTYQDTIFRLRNKLLELEKSQNYNKINEQPIDENQDLENIINNVDIL